MHTPKFPKELHALSLAQYMMTRIRQHANIYQTVIHSYTEVKNDETLFLTWYLLMTLHLQEGNTVLWCNPKHDDESDVWGLASQGLVGWQFELVKKLLPLFDDVLGEPYGHFGADVVAMLSLSAGKQLSEFVEQKQTALTNQAYTLGASEKAQLGELVRLIFGFVYITSVRFGGDLWRFYTHLRALSFFNEGVFVLSTWHESGFGVWFARSYLAESGLVRDVARLLSAQQTPIHYTPIDGLNQTQKEAIVLALAESFVLITGGPGTGKTFTVGQLVIQLLQNNPDFQLALVAPTGKAAQRMQESLQNAIGQANIQLPDAMTIHRLLGMGIDGVPQYHKDNQLPFDMIVVDEASMLGVELAQKLICAVATGTRLIVLGDANQLSAVEAGAVLGDLCRVPSLEKFHKKLVESRRFDGGSAVGQLAKLVQNNMPIKSILHLLQDSEQLDFIDVGRQDKMAIYEALSVPFLAFFERCKHLNLGKLSTSQKTQALGELFATLSHYRILTASHQGVFGDVVINEMLAKRHFAYQNPNRPIPAHMYEWYHGRVVMVIKNSYELGLFNGDIGVCLNEYQNNQRQSLVYFEGKEAGIPVAMLPEMMVTTAYAMTIHKSQGSEFDHVAVCFDDSNAKLLGRELIYTGITRAKTSVSIFATPSALERAVLQETVRQTGLSFLFSGNKSIEQNPFIG